MRIFFTFLLLLFAWSITPAQVKPSPGAELNYNQVMLEHPASATASGYIIQIAEDSSFAQPVIEIRDSFNAIIISNLEFGKSYYWRYRSIIKNKPAAWEGPYLFKILPNPYRDFRVHLLQNDSVNNAGGLVLVDEFHSIYNRNGKLVWFMPPVTSGFRKDADTYDMKFTSAGTLTVLTAENGLEMNLTGKMLWMTPFKPMDSVLIPFGTFYNHDFKRLPNNNYMVIGRQLQWKKVPEDYDIYKIPYYLDTATWHPVLLGDGKQAETMAAGFFLRRETDGIYLLVNMADITEFDANDSVVWHWNAKDYLREEDFLPKALNLRSAIREQEPRLNGFCVDAQNQFVYASFRNLDRVVKIEKSTGKVVYSWGTKMPSGEARDGADFFHKQHAPMVMNDGNIVVFNNADMDSANEPSRVVVFSQPLPGKPSEILWKFNCIFDSVMRNNKSARAGNVDILPNDNFMVCMGGNNRIFEATSDKRIVWNALVERRLDAKANWMPCPIYRAHYSSSLYPCYYTIETDCDSAAKNRRDFVLTVNNVGSENDSYNISITSSSKHYNRNLGSGLVNKRNRIKFKISPLSKPAIGERIEVSVKSHNNPDFERRLELVVN